MTLTASDLQSLSTRLEKDALLGQPSPLQQAGAAAKHQLAQQETQKQLVQALTKWIGGAVAVGAGARGLVGLGRMFQRPIGSVPQSNVVEIPMPDDEEKFAEDGWLNWLTDLGGDAQAPEQIPLYGATMALGVPAGLYAGYKGIDMLSDSLRQRRRKHELARANQQFQSTVRQALGARKVAESTDEEAATEFLDEEFAEVGKQADPNDWGSWANRLSGEAANYYLTFAVPMALASAYGTYNVLKPTRNRTILQRAESEKRRRQQQAANIPLYAVPQT